MLVLSSLKDAIALERARAAFGLLAAAMARCPWADIPIFRWRSGGSLSIAPGFGGHARRPHPRSPGQRLRRALRARLQKSIQQAETELSKVFEWSERSADSLLPAERNRQNWEGKVESSLVRSGGDIAEQLGLPALAARMERADLDHAAVLADH